MSEPVASLAEPSSVDQIEDQPTSSVLLGQTQTTAEIVVPPGPSKPIPGPLFSASNLLLYIQAESSASMSYLLALGQVRSPMAAIELHVCEAGRALSAALDFWSRLAELPPAQNQPRT